MRLLDATEELTAMPLLCRRFDTYLGFHNE